MPLTYLSKISILLSYCFLLCVCTSVVYAQKDTIAIQLNPQESNYRLGTYTSYLTTEREFSFDSILLKKSDFLPYVKDDKKIILPPNQVAWFKIPIKSNYDHLSRWFLQVTNGEKNTLFIPQSDSSYQQFHFGLAYADSLQNVFPNYHCAIFDLKKGYHELYLRVVPSDHAIQSGGYQQTFLLLRNDVAQRRFSISLVVNTIMYSVILALLLYNILLYFTVHHVSYLYYCIAIFSMGMYFYTLPALKSYMFWGQLSLDAQTNRIANYIAIFSTVIFWVNFLQAYFNTKKYFFAWHRYFTILLTLNVLAILMYSFFIENLTNRLANVLNVLSILMILTFSIYAYYKKHLLAKPFLIANAFLCVFALLHVLDLLNWISSNVFTTYFALQVGVLGQIILFSLALASRINILRQRVNQQILEKERLERQQLQQIQQLTTQKNNDLEQKVQERTHELSEKNIQLEQIIEELDATNETLRYTIDRVEEQNTQITASITYAKRIQDALLPNPEKIQEYLPESFFILKPLQVVSGDFYWFLEYENQLFLGVFDCTGHGVPGAFMSLVANELLNEIILYKKIYSPEKILEELHKDIQHAFKQTQNKSQDTIDGNILRIEAQKIYFAGARNPIFIADSKGVRELQVTRKSIGGTINTAVPFKLFELPIHEQTDIYMLSDGLQDQFGETSQKKFKKKGVKELLNEISNYDINLQKRTIESTIENWQGNLPQTDDMIIVGLRFGG